jgi:hypothetical protein
VLLSTSAWYAKPWIQQIEATFETCKRVDVFSLYPMFTDPEWNNNSSNRQRAKEIHNTMHDSNHRNIELMPLTKVYGCYSGTFLDRIPIFDGVWFGDIKAQHSCLGAKGPPLVGEEVRKRVGT